jgi:hypothetical protein
MPDIYPARSTSVTNARPIIIADNRGPAPKAAAVNPPGAITYAYDGDRLVWRGGLSTHKHVFKSELKSC